MKDSAIKHLDKAIEQAALADALSICNGTSNHFLQICNGENNEIVVQGNSEGLTYLALSILRLATSKVGAHQHFDEAGIVDHCDYPLVVAKCLAEWE